MLLLSVLLSGLMLVRSALAGWMPVEGPYLSQDGYQIEMPAGWMLRTPVEDELYLTRDGIWLQFLRVARIRFDQATGSLKNKLTRDMDPLKVAELIASEFRALEGVVNFQVAESVPVQIDGRGGFRMVFHYTTRQDMKKSGVYYGVIHGDSFYFVHYDAPSRYYFNRYHSTVERLKNSFKINP